MRKGSTVIAGLSLLLIAASAASAQDAPNPAKPGGSRWLTRLDTNQDGAVEQSEMQAARDQMFKRLDTNGDGVISEDEFNARANKLFSRLDKNGDGKLTQDELAHRSSEQKPQE